jgi:tetratricopeptide (TPR) repeat protein
LGQEYEKAKKKILAGIHPSSKQALTKVGSYMAWALGEEAGKEALRTYHRQGPIAFFNDYIRLSEAGPSPKRHPRFHSDFSRLVAEWASDWARTNTDEVRRLAIMPGTDFESVISRLKEAFAGASIFPDISPDLTEAAEYFLKKKDDEKAASILTLGRQLYPASPLLAAALGYVQVWRGQIAEGEKLYFAARDLDPTHPVLRAGQFATSIRQLVEADKRKEALALGLTAVELNPKDPGLYTAIGELSILAGEKGKAVEYLKKALRIDPDFEEAKTRLKSLER